MLTVEDYLAKIQVEEILYINKIPLHKIILDKVPVLNPMTMKYRNFWNEEIRKSIDGFWVEHNEEWKFIPGMLYFYGSHWHILLNERGSKSKTKSIAKPLIRDLEWIKFYLFMEARGFSGFEDDEEYTCHREVSLPQEERTAEFMGKGCYNKEGKLKKYVHAREYLWKYHKKPLGKALYENMALNVVDLESRGTGKSYTMACLGGGNWVFDGAQDYEEYMKLKKEGRRLSSETVIGAIDSKYSDDLVKKIRLGLESFQGEFSMGRTTTPPPLSRAYTGQWIAGKTVVQEEERKVGGQWKRVGTFSKIQHRTFMDNEFAANGTRGSVNILDEIGFFYNLIETLGQMKECTADGAVKFGTIWMTGTGGDMEGGSTSAVMKVFYDPATHFCVEFEDYYEASGQKIGFFVPAWMGLNQFKDELGNTNYKAAIQFLLNVRKKLALGKDRSAYDAELSQRPLIPSEVFLIAGGNMLPVGMLKDVLSGLETSNNPEDEGVVGHMKVSNSGEIEFVPDLKGKLRECDWPVRKENDNTGAVVIFEPPEKNAGFGYYLAGNDPYDQDFAPNSVSLGSLILMKRASPGVSSHDYIVAEYSGRPETAKYFYEQCRLLLTWYNVIGSCLYENEKIGIKTYFENLNVLFLLAPTPTIMKSNISSNVNRGLGQHMSTKVKDEAEIMLRDWLIAPAGDGKLNLHNIKSKPLLKELINYNKIGNFDRVIALMLCVIQMTQMYKVRTEAAEEEVREDPFFTRPLFQNQEISMGSMNSNYIGNNFN